MISALSSTDWSIGIGPGPCPDHSRSHDSSHAARALPTTGIRDTMMRRASEVGMPAVPADAAQITTASIAATRSVMRVLFARDRGMACHRSPLAFVALSIQSTHYCSLLRTCEQAGQSLKPIH